MAALIDQHLPALRDGAGQAMQQAYAPYSKFRVGAALLTESGAIVCGCNVENAAYPAGICAERVAVGAAVAAGHRRFSAVMIVSEASEPTPPCGICRQVLVEFGSSLQVVSRTIGGSEARWSLDELLPRPFTPSSLQSR